ncbi:MAG: polysaccharide biosynthesis/export family protein [Planctomycetes bacterium]|nr:polysaccharide biosynthesis/export family protein [Planctomycetota bacterium]
MRILALLTLLITAGLLSSCIESDVGEPPEGRTAFRVDPVQPVMPAYRGVQNSYTGRENPNLPPETISRIPVVRPVSAEVYNTGDLPVSAVAQDSTAYDLGDLLPVKQLIYGGPYGDQAGRRDYQLAVGDELTLDVEDHPELSGTVVVLTDGSIELPLVKKSVPARGRTLHALEQDLLVRLQAYALDPYLTKLRLDYAGGNYYYIFGEVKNPGRYPMGANEIRVSEAVFRANSASLANAVEGLSMKEQIRAETETPMRTGYRAKRFAEMNRVYLITPHRSRPTRRIIDVQAALQQGLTGNDPYLRQGQIIFVPSAADVRLARFFKRIIAPLGPELE